MGLLLSATAIQLAFGLGLAYPIKTLLLFAAGAALLWHGLRVGAHPHTRFGAANRVTLVRLALMSLLAGLLDHALPSATPRTPLLAWSVMSLATLTALLDAVDGLLARHNGLASPFGARFDMETDAAFTLVLCALVVQAGQAGPWVLASGFMRYVFMAAARLWPWLAMPLGPSRRRQTLCVVQITALIVCLAPIVPPWLATPVAAVGLALLSLSFCLDVQALAQARRRMLVT
jgi:phosphatidylglycerophosphate synthase